MEVDPPRLLVHTWIASYGDPAKTVVRWELESRDVHGLHQSGPRRMGTGTLVRLQHQGFAGNVQSALGHGEGWRRILGWMAAFVENEDTVDTRPAVPPATGTKG